jgi:hypothetical protein
MLFEWDGSTFRLGWQFLILLFITPFWLMTMKVIWQARTPHSSKADGSLPPRGTP